MVSYNSGWKLSSSVTRHSTPSSGPPYEYPADLGRSENHTTYTSCTST
jgi:hypothetical protein